VIYKSHLEEINPNQCRAFFRCKERVFYQSSTGSVCESKFGVHRNVKMLSVQFSKNKCIIADDTETFIYESKVQLNLLRTYLSAMSPEKHEQRFLQQREYEINRNKDATRQEYRRNADKTPKRKAREQTEERRKMHSEQDSIEIKQKKEEKCTLN
jgi:hypothetical protein